MLVKQCILPYKVQKDKLQIMVSVIKCIFRMKFKAIDTDVRIT